MLEVPSSPATPVGLRERGKLDRKRRIMLAARDVFIQSGYAAATTREIAIRADVSIGTIFVYAKDKRDLLLLVVNDELDQVGVMAGNVLDAPGSLLERLSSYFQVRYEYWAREPRLARPVLRETYHFLDPADTEGEQAQRFYARRSVMLAQVEHAVHRAQAAAEVVPDVSPARVATILINLYLIEVRKWLAGADPDAAWGIEQLSGAVELFLRGVLVNR